jgi:hypothetical protein
MGSDGVYEIVNARTDYEQGPKQYYSKTRLIPDRPSNVFPKYPTVIRGETIIFGSNLDGTMNSNLVMQKREKYRSEVEVLKLLREEIKFYVASQSLDLKSTSIAGTIADSGSE